MDSLQALKSEIKNTLLDEGIGPALKQLRDALPENSKAYDEIVLLEAELKEANLKMMRGTMPQSELDVKYNSLRERLLLLLDALEQGVFDAAASGKKQNQGSLLYQIPSTMAVQQETRCRVRIAYDEASLLENIELTKDTKLTDVRIAEVMEVELIDPAAEPAFSIRTFNRQEQFIEKEEYTEWQFFITPLRAGDFPLLLRVAVIEEVGGKDRTRDIVLEERVVIVAEPVAEPETGFGSSGQFKAAGLLVVGLPRAAAAAGNEGGAEAAAPSAPPPAMLKKPSAWALAIIAAIAGLVYLAVPAAREQVNQLFSREGKGAPASEEATPLDTAQLPLPPASEPLPDSVVQPDPPPADDDAPAPAVLIPPDPASTTDRPSVRPEPGPGPGTVVSEGPRPATIPEPPVERPTPPGPAPLSPPIVKLEADMVRVAGGTFTMGCLQGRDESCGENSWEEPTREVSVSAFSIGRYEVTQAQWQAVMGSDPSFNQGCDDCPVERVNSQDIRSFLRKLNELTGKRYRLPSEAEWEYAARGGNQSRRYRYSGSNNLDEVGWYNRNARQGNPHGAQKTTRQVGLKKPNELGLYDMSGNVGEWVEDDWHDSYRGAPADGRAWTDSPRGRLRVDRGGSWASFHLDCRSAYRNFIDGGSYAYGFRIASD